VIRPATPADAATLASIQEQASLAGLAYIYPPERYPFPRQAVEARWDALWRTALLAEVKDEAVGFVATDPPWLDALYLLPDAWGTGVATELHEAGVEALAAAGVVRARLWVLEENRRARRFYERRGWVADGSTRVVPFPPHPLDLGYALDL
jgi:GNAT superfamily N-acetyltransferase